MDNTDIVGAYYLAAGHRIYSNLSINLFGWGGLRVFGLSCDYANNGNLLSGRVFVCADCGLNIMLVNNLNDVGVKFGILLNQYTLDLNILANCWVAFDLQ